MYKDSQKGQILSYMKGNVWKWFKPDDFMIKRMFNFSWTPFIGYKASSRLSELKKMWLVEIMGVHKSTMKFHRKARDRNLYTITPKWLKYKLV
jgi:hypothetical protein